jgi:hypothetical protein
MEGHDDDIFLSPSPYEFTYIMICKMLMTHLNNCASWLIEQLFGRAHADRVCVCVGGWGGDRGRRGCGAWHVRGWARHEEVVPARGRRPPSEPPARATHRRRGADPHPSARKQSLPRPAARVRAQRLRFTGSSDLAVSALFPAFVNLFPPKLMWPCHRHLRPVLVTVLLCWMLDCFLSSCS